jgi:hypothetical protein
MKSFARFAHFVHMATQGVCSSILTRTGTVAGTCGAHSSGINTSRLAIRQQIESNQDGFTSKKDVVDVCELTEL